MTTSMDSEHAQHYHSIYAADGFPLTLSFDQPGGTGYPGKTWTLEQQRQYFHAEATRLVDLLQQHLPSGLVDALLGTLMLRRASTLIVRQSSQAGPTETGETQ